MNKKDHTVIFKSTDFYRVTSAASVSCGRKVVKNVDPQSTDSEILG
jgi:hypothetical protein